MLRGLPDSRDRNLLVGIATGDDAGVYQLASGPAIVQTVDFFTPIVDDAYTFGRIAAANALSDVYAMGGTPVTALNIACFPTAERDISELAAVLRGGSDTLQEEGVALLGGHTVDDPEPKYGMCVTGIVDPEHVATNAGARPGDRIVLTKPLGTGVVTTARKFDECPDHAFEAAVASMMKTNAGAAAAMREVGIAEGRVHAATDITGFGLIGHLYQLAKASGVRIVLRAADVPVLPEADALAAAGNVTRAERETPEYIGAALTFGAQVPKARRSLLLDPQTSGGLAICVASQAVGELVDRLRTQGTLVAQVIGHVERADSPAVVVE